MAQQSLVTISEASQILGVSEAALRQWTDEGKIKAFITPGGHRRYARTELKKLIDSHQKVHGVKDLVAELADSIPRHREIMRTSGGNTSPFNQLDRKSGEHFAELGRRLLNLIVRYLSEPSKREELIKLAQDVGNDHGATLAKLGLPLTDSMEAFIMHRNLIMKAATQLMKKGEAFNGRLVEAIPLVDRIMDEALVSLVAAHQHHQDTGQSQSRGGVIG